jgi:hypothetical protein
MDLEQRLDDAFFVAAARLLGENFAALLDN